MLGCVPHYMLCVMCTFAPRYMLPLMSHMMLVRCVIMMHNMMSLMLCMMLGVLVMGCMARMVLVWMVSVMPHLMPATIAHIVDFQWTKPSTSHVVTASHIRAYQANFTRSLLLPVRCCQIKDHRVSL